MPTIIETLQRLPMAGLSGHIEVAHGTLAFSADAALDPSALLGDFGELLRTIELPSSPADIAASVADGLGRLQSLVQLPQLSALGETAVRVAGLVSLVEEVAAHFTGDLGRLIEELLGGAGGIEQVFREMAEQLLQSLPIGAVTEVAGTLTTLGALVGQPLRSAEQVAAIVAQLVAGVGLDDLRAPGLALDGFVARIHAAGGDGSAVGAAIAGLTARVRAAAAQIVQADGDIDAVVAEIEQIAAGLDLLVSSTLPGAMGRLTGDLSALDLGHLHAELDGAFKRLTGAIPHVSFDLLETIGETVGHMLVAIAATTEEELSGKFQLLKARLHESFALSGLAGATAGMDELFDFIVDHVQQIGLRRLRHEVVDALNAIEARIRGFGGFSAPAALIEQIERIVAAVDRVDTAAVRDKVQAVVGQINGVVAQFPIEAIRGEAEGLIGQAAEAVDQLGPLFDQVTAQLDALAQHVVEIDLSAAGQASIDLMKEIRANVQKVAGSGDLPEPAKVAIGAGAAALKSINLTVEISQPFHAVIDGIDPSVVLAPVRPVLVKMEETLNAVAPSALIAQLDGPFRHVQAELDKLRPANLVTAVSGQFARLSDLVDKADPQALVAPLEAEFQKLLAAARRALDPAPLFAPLRAAFARLLDLLKQLDIRKLLGAITDGLLDAPGSMGKALEGALQSRGLAEGALPAVGAGEFKMGGFLRPLTHFLGQLRRQLTRLARDLLQQAWVVLRAPLRAIDELAQPALGVAGVLAQAVDARLAALDLFGASGPAAELRQAIEDLVTAQRSVHVEASADGRLGSAVMRLDLGARADVLAAPRAAAEVQRRRLHAESAPPAVSGAIQRVAELYAELLPPSLLGDGPVDNVLDLVNELLDKIDPTPLADKLDEIGEQAMAKLKTMFGTIVRGVFGLVNEGVGLLEEFSPIGLVKRFELNMGRLAAECAALDPAPIEAEVRELVDAVLSVVETLSPASLAAVFGGIFDAARAKLGSLSPAALLGDLSAIDAALDQFGRLRPSAVLAPLVERTAGLTEMLKKLAGLSLGDVVVTAVARLKAQLEDIVAGLEQELRALLDYLEGLAGGASVSVSASASVG